MFQSQRKMIWATARQALTAIIHKQPDTVVRPIPQLVAIFP